MGNENYNEEIDVMQVFSMFKKFFKGFLRSVISVIRFYKKKWILFLILLVFGGAIGFFIDRNEDIQNEYIQEIIIEPKYNTTKFVYDFIEELDRSFNDDYFLEKLGINAENIKNLNKITIEPLIKGTDVLDNLQERYENREFFKDIMTAYEEDKLKEEEFRNFYKHHRLILKFKNKNTENTKISSSILKYIKSNEYYQNVMNFTIAQNKSSLEKNKKSLQFIDKYLDNLNNSPSSNSNELVVIANESEAPTIASLLKQKDLLLEEVNEQEKILVLDKEVLSVVDYGDIISTRKKLLNRTVFIIPLLLIGLISLFYFLRYLNREIKEFVKDE
ncbi:putative membrane protein [Aquimarina sp. EL_43]|uniref:hypothetical protein n=1 Tax=unclassified Aquimarina TaxID=2627091 RepID=UPI0018CA5207|nr:MULTISPECIES: hypothetical protein [unclassified Aquimarina]MBG6131722.1 putative membrane protein [Aquimarina sp. EL_35]MBG6152183.1 putative membrane protein [Aquimarina sp. EL_32]MBG6169873.1 putative membrane protein [Aquimarina sp. EL_43]